MIFSSRRFLQTSLKYFQPLKRESSFSIHKFPKVQVTQLVQSPSHLRCPMSKFPKLSRPKLLKVQVTQSSSHPKLKLPKVQVAQIAKSPSCPHIEKTYCSPMAKNIYGPQMAKNNYGQPMAKNIHGPLIAKNTFSSHYYQYLCSIQDDNKINS